MAASIGTIAFLSFPCTGTDGAKLSESVASATAGVAGSILRASAVLSTVETTVGDKKTTDETTSRVENVTAFGGALTADALVAVSRTTATRSRVSSDDAGTTFVNLKIAGKRVDPNVAPNTPFDLPGLGIATVKEQRRGGDGEKSSSLALNMIAIRITSANAYGLPIGATVVIGHAASSFQRGAFDVALSGKAYATRASASVDGVLSGASGETALQPIGCLGTDGERETTNIAGITVDGVTEVAAGKTTAMGDDRVAKTTARLLRVSLLNGLVVAGEVKAIAETSLVDGKRARSTKGSAVTGLKILGVTVPVAVGPNTQLDLPGIGYIVANEQIVPPADSDANTVVNALRIVVTKNNLLGLPIGANVIVGHAAAGIERVAAGS